MLNNSTGVNVINIAQKLSLFSEHWNPKIIGELNDHKVQAVKLKGPFQWHHHENEDEMFLVVNGRLTIHFRDRDVVINTGEFIIIPHLLEHMPEALEEVEILLIEPKTALNTGNVKSDMTVTNQENL